MGDAGTALGPGSGVQAPPARFLRRQSLQDDEGGIIRVPHRYPRAVVPPLGGLTVFRLVLGEIKFNQIRSYHFQNYFVPCMAIWIYFMPDFK